MVGGFKVRPECRILLHTESDILRETAGGRDHTFSGTVNLRSAGVFFTVVVTFKHLNTDNTAFVIENEVSNGAA